MASHAELGLALLTSAWQEVSSDDVRDVDENLVALADAVLAGKEGGYKKAIIIQAAGKAADPLLDAQAMQRGEGRDGSWDAREFAKKVFVPWNLAANEPFSHSADPYVSNPYRIPRFDESQRASRKDKNGFDAALAVLVDLNRGYNSEVAYSKLKSVLYSLKKSLVGKDVLYPLPNRASLESVEGSISSFLQSKSGGTRLQAVVAALFMALRSAGLNLGEIASSHVNASDTSSSKAGDLSFRTDRSLVAVEVKDRSLTKDELIASIEKARIAAATDLIFVVRSSTVLAIDLNAVALKEIAATQFSSGLNIYVEPFDQFMRVCLTMIGEAGRRTFLEDVGTALADQKAGIEHKWAWAAIVKAL